MYKYKAEVLRVVDGDTVRLSIDLGFTVKWESNCRLYGINAPELHDPSLEVRERAMAAKLFLMETLPIKTSIEIESKMLDKYGRPLVVITKDNIIINDYMLEKGLAVSYLP